MAAVFSFATCSYCRGQLYNEAQPVNERYAMLGSCAHRFCHFCSLTWLSRPSYCPLCQMPVAMKRTLLSNASHMVELLSSCLSEANNRILKLENFFEQISPHFSVPTTHLFDTPLLPDQTLYQESDQPLSAPIMPNPGPQYPQQIPFDPHAAYHDSSAIYTHENAQHPYLNNNVSVQPLRLAPKVTAAARREKLESLNAYRADDIPLGPNVNQTAKRTAAKKNIKKTSKATAQSQNQGLIPPLPSNNAVLPAKTLPKKSTAKSTHAKNSSNTQTFLDDLRSQFEN